MKRRLALLALLGLLVGCGCGPDPAYVDEIDTWHAGRIDRLRSDTGWLTLVGLHPLKSGQNTLGSDPAAMVRLPAGAPARLGDLRVDELGVFFNPAPDAEVFPFGAEGSAAVRPGLLKTDRDGAPTVLSAGTLVFHVIDRDGRLFLRVKDREAGLLKSFEGIDRFPVDDRWRITATLEPGEGTVAVPNVLGQTAAAESPGVLVFKVGRRPLRLVPTGDPKQGLFVVFGDDTNNRTTYGGGRFLSTGPVDAEGRVVLDFNKAVNPPCVFTPYATCPLPPRDNLLAVEIPAGEKMWGDHH